MDLTYPPEAEEFRAEIGAWLDENLPDGWGSPDFAMKPAERKAFDEQWTKKLYDGGWICASWPQEYGGKGLSLIQNVVLNEEFATRRAPMRADFFGDTLVGPTILQWGTEEQKHLFLPKILRGEITWCQGFSEPNSGSDLASLTTKAVLDGDEWVVTGQKVWTTQAQYADYCFVLARTDPDVAKHAGISYLLVPMRQKGIEVRSIIQPDGSDEFNEVFFDGARCPRDWVVGGVNNGWKVAMTTLGFERGASTTTGFRRFEREWRQVRTIARENGRGDDPLVRQDLARAWGKVKIMEINGYRQLTDAVHGTKKAAAVSALNKINWSEYHQWFMEVFTTVQGPMGQILQGSSDDVFETSRHRGGHHYPVSPLQAAFFFSRSETIWGGTSQIQRNIVGERVLGLPKEPKVDQVSQS
ncbi:MAG TPA: acyl-CoA dehydrogenase family protein [Acidimicrobiales bacterium]